MDTEKDYYAILGVDVDATPEEIQKAIRRAIRTHHPDVTANGLADTFLEVQEAKEVLGNPVRRREYDRRRRPAGRATNVRMRTRPHRPGAFLEAAPGAADWPGRPFDRLNAQVILSRVEAACGVDLPVTVPLQTDCPSCAGRRRGRLGRCVTCAGSGSVTVERKMLLRVPPGSSHGARFEFIVRDPYVRGVVVAVSVQVSDWI